MSGNGPGPCWWVCKYCKRAFPRSEELVAHKKGTHRLQFLKDKNAKKLKKSTKLCTSGTDEHNSVASVSSNQDTDQISDSGTTEVETLTNIVTASASKTLLYHEESISSTSNSSKILIPVVTPLTVSEPDPLFSTSKNSNTTCSSFEVPAIKKSVITSNSAALLEVPLESQETELESLTNNVVTEASLNHAESTSALSSTRQLIPVITPLRESEPAPLIPSTSKRLTEVRATKKIVVTSSAPLIPLKSIITLCKKKRDSSEIRAESSSSSSAVTSTTTAKRVKFNLPEDYRGSSSSSEDDFIRVTTTKKIQNENNEKPETSSMPIPSTSKSRPSLKPSKNENPSISASPKSPVVRRRRMKRKIRFTFIRKIASKSKAITSNSKRKQINFGPKRNPNSVTESVPKQKSPSSKKNKLDRNRFKCTHCNKICKSHQVRVEHERIHTGEKPHVCSTCKVAFGFKASYNRHCLRPHTFHCSRCPLKFTMENHLKKHQVFHEGRQKQNQVQNQPSRQNSLQNLSSISSPVLMEEKVIPVASVKPFLPGRGGGPSSTKPLELIQKFESSNSINSSSSSDCLRNPKIPIQTPLISRLRLKLQRKRTFSYRCRTCYKIFDKPKERMDHEENTHGGIPAQNKCRFCGKILRLNYQLITHERMHTGERPYNCAYCERTFSLSSNQLTHMRNIHSAQFAADSKILRNQARATTPSSSPRTRTRRSSSTGTGTGRASRQFRQSSKYPAPMPTRSSSSSSRSPSPRKVQQQQQQQRVKLSSNSNSDSDSDLEAKPKPELTGNSDSNSKYFCKKCKIGFLSDKLLVAHKLMHTYENRYNCPYCPKAFKSSGILIAHKRTHTGERPFPCQFCELKFRHLQNVKRHEQTIHKYVRQGQGEGANTNKVGNVHENPNSSKAQFKIRLLKVNNSWNHFVSSLKKRSRVSVRRSRTITKLKTRPVRGNKDDDSQDKALEVAAGSGTSRRSSNPGSSRSSSVSHVRNEAGNFECQYCSKEFNGKNNVVIHERIHSGEKPHVCPYTDCQKGFTQSHSLKEHIRTHTGERPFVCPECGRCFVAQSALQAHLKNVHLVKNLTRKYRQKNQIRRASNGIPKILEIKAKPSTSASICSLASNSKDVSVDSVDVIATSSKNTRSEVMRMTETASNAKPQSVVHVPVSVSVPVQIQVSIPTTPLPLATAMAGPGHTPEEISKQIPSQRITKDPVPSLSHSVADKAVVVINNRNINFNLKSGTPTTTTVAAAALGPSTSVSIPVLTSATSSKTTKILHSHPATPVKTSTKSISGFSILKRKKKNHGLKNSVNVHSNSKSTSSSSSNNGLPSCIQQKLNLHVLQYVCITCDRRFSYRIDAVRHAAQAHPSSTYIYEVKWRNVGSLASAL